MKYLWEFKSSTLQLLVDVLTTELLHLEQKCGSKSAYCNSQTRGSSRFQLPFPLSWSDTLLFKWRFHVKGVVGLGWIGCIGILPEWILSLSILPSLWLNYLRSMMATIQFERLESYLLDYTHATTLTNSR